MSRRLLRCGRAGLYTHLLVAMLIAGLLRPVAAQASASALLTPSVSAAASGPRLAIVVVGLDPKARAQAGTLESAAEAAASRAGRFTIVPSYDALNPAAAKARAGSLAVARKRVQAGKQNLEELDNAKATEAFGEALGALKDADSTTSFKDTLEALMLKAASHATGGENAAAKKAIEAVLSLNARAEFSPTYFSPDLIKYAEAQRKALAGTHGELTVSTSPSGARVWVDGAFQGTSPVTVAGLSPVKHLVAAAGPGTQLLQTELGLGEEKLSLEPAELSGAWKKALGVITSDPEGPGRDRGASELGQALGVDQVLLIEAKKSTAGEQFELIASRVDSRDGHNWSYRATTVGLGKPDAVKQLFDSLVGQDTPRDGKSPVTHYKQGSSDRALLSYGLMGVGAAGVATGAVFGFMALDRSNAWRATKQTEVVKSNALKSQGQTFAIVADVSFIVGIAAAATGTVLLLTNKGNAGDSAPSAAPPADDGAARRKAEDAERRKRDQDRRDAEDRAKAEEKAPPPAAAAPADEDEKPKKLTKKQQREEEERKRKDDEARAAEEKKAAEDAKKASKKQQREEEERKRKDDEARAAEEKKAAAAAAAEDDEKPKKLTKKQRDEEERKRKDDEARAAKEEDRRKLEQDEADRKKRENDDRRRIEDEKRKKDEADKKKKKEEDHDDLRNY